MLTKCIRKVLCQGSRNQSTFLGATQKVGKANVYRAEDRIDEDVPSDWNHALPFSEVPGPRPSKIFGNTWRFIPKIGSFSGIPMADLYKKFCEDYGEIMVLRCITGRRDTVFLYSPSGIEKLLRNDGIWPMRKQLSTLKRYRTKVRKDIFQDASGLMSLQGESWFRMRSTVNPILMQPRIRKIYLGSLNTVGSEFIEFIRNHSKSSENGEMPGTFANDIHKWSLESMGVVALDKHLGCLRKDLDPESKTQKIINAILSSFDLMYKIEVQSSFWRYYRKKNFEEFTEVLDFLTYTILEFIREAKDNMERTARKPVSAFERMIEKNETIATAMCIDMIMAGIDTVSKTFAAVLYYLACHKNTQQTLREELKQLMPKKDSDVSEEMIDRSPYLKAVIKETTRLAPITVGNIRTTQKNLVLCGYQIPKGTQVLCNHMYLCRQDEHFPRANEFLPERFLRENTGELSYKNTHPFICQPFGFGPRSCVGRRLACLEMEVAISKVI